MRKSSGGGERRGKGSRKCGVVSYVNVFAAVYVFTFNATSNSVALTPGKGKPAPPAAPPALSALFPPLLAQLSCNQPQQRKENANNFN